ncbi:hypothetical protein APT59_10275 [Pseudomonas oryzihabitans]|uniref:Uncharacterized protein n=1 Tax=Pseudomonas oryzihabitans TaxID=47885 RepID=A0A0U4WPE4_9PSED|nr:hypothetical protein [Pseudomonas oryzihabitans]ALZ84563.1 hypothetical protein APT59_10275 [Pseudomonas oryzihabitans]
MSSLGKLSPDIAAARTVTHRLVLLLLGFFALAIVLTRLPTFINASSGETWQIRGGQIPLMQYPSMPERSVVANRQLITLLNPDDRILVLDSAPFRPWKKVMLIGEDSRVGWIRVTPALGAVRVE